jgi:hypothetical protein
MKVLIIILALLPCLCQGQSLVYGFMRENNIKEVPKRFITCIEGSGDFYEYTYCVYKYAKKFEYYDNGVQLLKTYKEDLVYQFATPIVEAGHMDQVDAERYITYNINSLIDKGYGIHIFIDKSYTSSKLYKEIMKGY